MSGLGLGGRDGALCRNLDVLVFEGFLCFQELLSFNSPRRKLFLSDWSFRVLVVHLHTGCGGDKETVVDLFLKVDQREQSTFLTATERVEFIGGPRVVEEQFRKAVEEKEKVGLSEFEKRIASLIVFVYGDGTERRLLEE